MKFEGGKEMLRDIINDVLKKLDDHERRISVLEGMP